MGCRYSHWSRYSSEICVSRKRRKYKDGKRVSEDEELIEKEEEVHVPANVQAQISWLCNRKPNDWKNIRIIGLTGGKGDGGPVEMTVDWAEEIKKAQERVVKNVQAQEP